MSDLEIPQPTEIANPSTGEMIDLTNPVSVASALAGVKELEDKLRVLRHILARALAEESKKRGEQTMFLPGFKVPISRSVTIQWDLAILRELKSLGLPKDRWEALVRTTIEEKVSANEATKIAKANPAYADVIKRARRDIEGEPTVGKIERYVG